jgi:Ca2+-binding RTX toxin-like protein
LRTPQALGWRVAVVNDTIYGGDGVDVIFGGLGADVEAFDLMPGGAQADVIYGGAGNDEIYSAGHRQTGWFGYGKGIDGGTDRSSVRG